jgi:hypothetical protein
MNSLARSLGQLACRFRPIAASARSSRTHLAIAVAALAWIFGVAAGVGKIHEFESTPGPSASAPDRWPAESRVQQLPGKDTLVILIHTECSCTGASLAELEQIMRRSSDRVAAWVLFTSPVDQNDEKARVRLKSLERTPGIHVMKDSNGAESKLFGALTSGDVVLYSAQGRLLFAGGITGSRGHEGDNIGSQLLLQALAQEPQASFTHPVFGCSLTDDASAATRNRSVPPLESAASR